MEKNRPQASPAILVVEDDELVRTTAAALLETQGYEVLQAATAQSALEVLEQRSDIRLLFTDVRIPGVKDGLGLARQIYERWPHIKLLVTSGQQTPNQSDMPRTASFLAKPYRAKVLFSEVDALLGSD
jgi:CheY-like chemotaxis protein